MEPSDKLATMACHVASIAAIPWEELADGAARGCLLEMAYGGLRVLAYPGRDGRWRICLEGHEMTCAEWSARFAV